MNHLYYKLVIDNYFLLRVLGGDILECSASNAFILSKSNPFDANDDSNSSIFLGLDTPAVFLVKLIWFSPECFKFHVLIASRASVAFLKSAFCNVGCAFAFTFLDSACATAGSACASGA